MRIRGRGKIRKLCGCLLWTLPNVDSCFLHQVEQIRSAGGPEADQADQMEADQDKLVEEIFSHEDKDKDGYISHDEFSGPKHDEL